MGQVWPTHVAKFRLTAGSEPIETEMSTALTDTKL